MKELSWPSTGARSQAFRDAFEWGLIETCTRITYTDSLGGVNNFTAWCTESLVEYTGSPVAVTYHSRLTRKGMDMLRELQKFDGG